MKRCLALIVALWVAVPLLPAYTSPDDEYIRIYNLIMQADALARNAEPVAAYLQYQVAQDALKKLQAGSPAWNEKLIDFRLHYVAEKMTAIAAKVPPGALSTNQTPKPAPAKAVSAEDLQKQVQTLQAELQRVDADRSLLAAKLKEALSAQPAAVDPRDLARAQEQVRALQKDNDLLKVELGEQKAKVGQWVDPSVHAATEKALAEANRKLAERGGAAAAAQRLAALEAENEVLKKQLAAPGAGGGAAANVADRQSRVGKEEAALQRDEVASLRREKTALEKQLLDARKLSQANTEKLATLQQKLAARSRKTRGRARSEAVAEERLAQEEITALRARLAVFEARKVPYTPEELALFKGAEAKPAAGSPASTAVVEAEIKPAQPVAHETPAEAEPLLAEAKQLSNAGRFADAEKSYERALRLDANNPSTLANLASVQLELGRLDDAEKNLKGALVLAPNDGFNLYLLGALRYHQNRYDDALDALGRAVKLDPGKAVIQNLLGVVLIQKGMRDQAETAFRKAIQLFPDYAEAHLNLARVYALHQPPLRALARFHYQKALDAGAAKDAGLEKFFAENPVGTEVK